MRTRDRLALTATALTLVLAGVLIGGATRWAAVIAALTAVAAVAVHLTSRRTASRPGPLVMLVAIATVATALQLVPLPTSIASIVAPEKLALVRDHATALGDPPPRWVVATHDAPATLVELAKLCGYLALAWTTTRLAAQRRARPWLAASIVGAATLVAVIALAHRVLGATELYGVFALPVPGHVPAPLINENHLASLTALVVPLALGLGLSWRGGKRVAAFAAALTLAATALLTASRGGAVGLVAGLVVAGIALVAQRRAGVADDNRRAPAAVTVPALIVGACALTLFGVVAARDVAMELHDTRVSELAEPTSKFQVWSTAAPMAIEHRWLGVGRGAFEPVFARHTAVGELTYSHAENSYLQGLLDWGVPVALGLGLALVALGRAALSRWRHGPLDAGALGGLAAIAIHDLADFSLELPAVAMTTIAIAALVAPVRLGTDDRKAPVDRRVRIARGAALALAAVIALLAASPLGRAARVDRAALPSTPGPATVAAARAVLARHPSDGLAAGQVAAALFAERDPRALPMMRRALFLRPAHGGLHLLAARMLLRSQRASQAAPEYARAIALAPDADPIVGEVVTRLPLAADAARALPLEARQVWRVCTSLANRGRHDVILAYTARLLALELAPFEASLNRAWAALALAQYRDALAAADRAHLLRPSTLTALARARALHGLERTAEAIAQLREAPRAPDSPLRAEVAATLAGFQRARGEVAAARDTLAAAVADLGDHPRLEAELRRTLAGVEDQLGHANQAVWERRRADELAPPNDSNGIAPQP